MIHSSLVARGFENEGMPEAGDRNLRRRRRTSSSGLTYMDTTKGRLLLEALESCNTEYDPNALDAAFEGIDDFAPVFVEALDDAIENGDEALSDARATALAIGLHILAHARRNELLRPLTDMLRNPRRRELSDLLLADAVEHELAAYLHRITLDPEPDLLPILTDPSVVVAARFCALRAILHRWFIKTISDTSAIRIFEAFVESLRTDSESTMRSGAGRIEEVLRAARWLGLEIASRHEGDGHTSKNIHESLWESTLDEDAASEISDARNFSTTLHSIDALFQDADRDDAPK